MPEDGTGPGGTTLRFRAATPDDVEGLVALVHAAYRGEPTAATWTTETHLLGGQRADAEMVRAAVSDPDSTVLVATDDSDPDASPAIVACCEVSAPDPDGTSVLGMFAVDPERQGGGLGRQVLAAGEDTATGLGATTLELHLIDVRVELIDWYRRRGYIVTDERHPFPYGDERFGLPRRDDLQFAVLRKELTP